MIIFFHINKRNLKRIPGFSSDETQFHRKRNTASCVLKPSNVYRLFHVSPILRLQIVN